MDQENATYALGEMVDHLAPSGKLETVQPTPSLWDQFSLVCPLCPPLPRAWLLRSPSTAASCGVVQATITLSLRCLQGA